MRRLASHAATLTERYGRRDPAARALRGETRRLSRLLDALEAERTLLRHLALADELTGLGNLRLFQARLATAKARSRTEGTPLAVAMIDVDHFKAWNDQHGHERGNRLLADLGALLGSCVRAGDTAARYGGDELAVLLPHTGAVDGSAWAGRLQRRCAEELAGAVTVSIGIAAVEGTDAAALVDGLVDEADAALYRAKARGGSCIVVAERAAAGS